MKLVIRLWLKCISPHDNELGSSSRRAAAVLTSFMALLKNLKGISPYSGSHTPYPDREEASILHLRYE